MLCTRGEDLMVRPRFCFEENMLLFKALMVVPKSSLARCKTLRDHLNYFVLFEAINSCWRWFKTEDKLTHCILCGQFIWIILLNWTNYELKQQTWRCKGKESLFFLPECRECARQMCSSQVLWSGPSSQFFCRFCSDGRSLHSGCVRFSFLDNTVINFFQKDISHVCPLGRGPMFQRRNEKFLISITKPLIYSLKKQLYWDLITIQITAHI